jgi:hypothetical protein
MRPEIDYAGTRSHHSLSDHYLRREGLLPVRIISAIFIFVGKGRRVGKT